MDIQTFGDTVEVRITYGNPAWKPLKDAGFVWNRPRKCYQAADSPARRQALEEMEDASDLFEASAKTGSGIALRHTNAYECRDHLKALGGRWNPDLKAWTFPDQWSHDQGLKVCRGGQPEPKKQQRQIVLYTAIKEAPLRKGGIFMQGSMPSVVFLRALIDTQPWKFYSGEQRDYFSGQVITSGYGWTYEVEEIEGEERQKLLG